MYEQQSRLYDKRQLGFSVRCITCVKSCYPILTISFLNSLMGINERISEKNCSYFSIGLRRRKIYHLTLTLYASILSCSAIDTRMYVVPLAFPTN